MPTASNAGKGFTPLNSRLSTSKNTFQLQRLEHPVLNGLFRGIHFVPTPSDAHHGAAWTFASGHLSKRQVGVHHKSWLRCRLTLQQRGKVSPQRRWHPRQVALTGQNIAALRRLAGCQ